jgi:dipeptidyl aminopeptidase/acylaminoacyl peptidase
MIRRKKHLVALCAFALALAAPLASAQTPSKHVMTFDDLIGLHRVSEAQVSPDGEWVAYRDSTPDKAANRAVNNLWIAPTSGGEPRQLTRSGRDTRPQWSPDGKTIAFLSSRDGETQIYVIGLDGGEAVKLTSVSTGVDNQRWSPDGKTIAFTSEVHPDCKDEACNKKRDADAEASKVKVHIADHLLYRHWNRWRDAKRSHLFVISIDGGGTSPLHAGTPRDLTPGADYDVPPDQRGDAGDIDFSPDSKELCFTAVTDKMEAISTNGDLFTVAVAGGEPKRITTNQGFDGQPAYSPDGRSMAYRAQMTPGYESDRWQLIIYDRATGQRLNLTEKFDRSVENPIWSPDSRTIYFHAESQTKSPIYAIAAGAGSEPRIITPDGFNSDVTLSADGQTLVFTRSSMTMPAEIFRAAPDGGAVHQITHHNAEKLAGIELSAPESFWFAGAAGTQVQAMILRPPHFDASKKYPLLVVLHGGPQTMFADSWGYRWNPQVFSGAGYVALMINRRGSTGFGQKFTDEITDDWGGKAYEDVMKGVDAALAKYSFIDGNRMAAAGGSYGGYMADWIATHTGRFKAIISHAGVYNKVSMYATEELWFEEHDMQGTPWSNPEGYRKWAPVTYAGELGKFKTPTLVIAGEMDYRVPYTQSLEFFSALQRQGVPSRLVVFPDEGHWILKPQNSELWYKLFLEWLATYLK